MNDGAVDAGGDASGGLDAVTEPERMDGPPIREAGGLVDAIADGAFTVTPTSGDFGSVDLFTMSMPLTITFTIANGTARNWGAHSSVSGPNASNFRVSANKCIGTILRPSQNCTLTVMFQPTDRGDRSATLNITGGPAPLSVPLSGRATTPAYLTVIPMEQDYGVVWPGMTSTRSFTVTNTGDAPAGKPALSFSSRETDFSITSNSCDGPVMPAQSCEIGVTFAPTTSVSAGLKRERLFLQGWGGETVGPTLVGYVSTGTASDGQLTLTSPGGPNPFGTVAFGAHATAHFSVQNSGAIAVAQVMAAIVGDTNQFGIAGNDCPEQLAVGATCSIQVSFGPIWPGHQTSILQVYTSASAYAAMRIGADTKPYP